MSHVKLRVQPPTMPTASPLPTKTASLLGSAEGRIARTALSIAASSSLSAHLNRAFKQRQEAESVNEQIREMELRRSMWPTVAAFHSRVPLYIQGGMHASSINGPAEVSLDSLPPGLDEGMTRLASVMQGIGRDFADMDLEKEAAAPVTSIAATAGKAAKGLLTPTSKAVSTAAHVAAPAAHNVVSPVSNVISATAGRAAKSTMPAVAAAPTGGVLGTARVALPTAQAPAAMPTLGSGYMGPTGAPKPFPRVAPATGPKTPSVASTSATPSHMGTGAFVSPTGPGMAAPARLAGAPNAANVKVLPTQAAPPGSTYTPPQPKARVASPTAKPNTPPSATPAAANPPAAAAPAKPAVAPPPPAAGAPAPNTSTHIPGIDAGQAARVGQAGPVTVAPGTAANYRVQTPYEVGGKTPDVGTHDLKATPAARYAAGDPRAAAAGADTNRRIVDPGAAPNKTQLGGGAENDAVRKSVLDANTRAPNTPGVAPPPAGSGGILDDVKAFGAKVKGEATPLKLMGAAGLAAGGYGLLQAGKSGVNYMSQEGGPPQYAQGGLQVPMNNNMYGVPQI